MNEFLIALISMLIIGGAMYVAYRAGFTQPSINPERIAKISSIWEQDRIDIKMWKAYYKPRLAWEIDKMREEIDKTRKYIKKIKREPSFIPLPIEVINSARKEHMDYQDLAFKILPFGSRRLTLEEYAYLKSNNRACGHTQASDIVFPLPEYTVVNASRARWIVDGSLQQEFETRLISRYGLPWQKV